MREYDQTHHWSDAEEESSDLGPTQSAGFFTPKNTTYQFKRSPTITWLTSEAPLDLLLIGTELSVLTKFANLVCFKEEQQSYLPITNIGVQDPTRLTFSLSNSTVDINLTITKNDCSTRNIEYYSKNSIFLFCDPYDKKSLDLIKRLILEINQEYSKKPLPHLVLLIVKSNSELELVLQTEEINSFVSTHNIDQCHEIDLNSYEMVTTKFQNILEILFTQQELCETSVSSPTQKSDNTKTTSRSFCTIM